MIKFLIVDDEPQARILLKTYMEELKLYSLIKLCGNAMEAYEAIQTEKIDLMFLDIKMPVLSGTDFLRSLRDTPKVILTTAYNKYAMEGYDLNVVDYLLKPISRPRLLQALQKVEERIHAGVPISNHRDQLYIFIKVENKLVKLNLKELILIESMQNYVKIHMNDRILIAPYTMKAIGEMLPPANFLRVHRSYIVATEIIKAIQGNNIETSYQQVPIGMNYKEDVMRFVNRK